MNNSWRYSDQQLPKETKKINPSYTRYNMSFRPTQTHLSMHQIKIQKNNTTTNFTKSKSCQPQNGFLFSKYSYFPVHNNKHRDLKASLQNSKKNENGLKWVGVQQVNQQGLDKTFSSRNAFPQRKTKGSDQLLINMLLKYEKHYGRQKQQSFSPIKQIINQQASQRVRYIAKKQKKIQTRIKWFKALQNKVNA